MIKLLFITNIFDDHLKKLISALRALEFNCILHPLNNQEWPEEVIDCFDSIASDYVQASNDSQVILITVDSKKSIDSIIQLDINTYRNQLIVDISRNPLKIRDENDLKIRTFLKHHNPYVIARDERQLTGPEKNPITCEAVISQDYLRFSYLPRPLIADIVWLFQKRIGNVLISQPPSTYIEKLISAPIDDKHSQLLADKILKIDKYFSYALFRKELNKTIANDSISQELKDAASHDIFFWNSSLTLLRHLPENSKIAKDLLNLKSHLIPIRPINNGRAKKRILLFVVKKQRDLFIDLMLCYWLETLGYEVIMRSLDDVPENSVLELLPNAIIWGARTTLYQMHLSRLAADRNIISIVRREESLSFQHFDTYNQTLKSWIFGHWDYSPLTDLELVSSEEYSEIIGTYGHMPRESCKSIGGMSMDPYFIPNLEQGFPGKEEFCQRLGLSSSKKIMLFASRWCYADRDPGTAIPEAISQPGQRADSVPGVKNILNVDRAGRKLWLEGITQLFKKRGDDWNFILKVHPGEKSDTYINYFQENNMHIPVILEGYMVELFKYVDLLIHAGSTTAIEAHLKNIPSISFCNDDPEIHPLVKLSPVATGIEKLNSLISDIELGHSNANTDIIMQLENEFYGKIDGKACRKASKFIDQLLKHVDTCPFRYPNDRYKPGAIKTHNTYGQSASEDEIDYYYQKVKNSIDKGICN